MTLHELIHRHEFDALVPDLVDIDPDNVPSNLYAFKEAFDDLRRMSPGDAHGEQIEVTTVVDTDEDGNELDRYIHASHCEGDAWDASLAKEVIFGTAIGEVKALARILWHMTFWGFTPEYEGFRDDAPQNKYERQAEALSRRQFLNYAKGIADSFDLEHLCLTAEGWKEYRRRESHRNRAKRMRDARQERSIARLERKGKVQRLIDRILSIDYGDTDMADLQYLFDTEAICEFDFFSRASTPDGRMEYIIDNLRKYFCPDDLKEYDRFEAYVEYSACAPITGEEASEIAGCIHSLIMKSHPGGEDTFRFRCHAGKGPSDSFDVHVLLVASR